MFRGYEHLFAIYVDLQLIQQWGMGGSAANQPGWWLWQQPARTVWNWNCHLIWWFFMNQVVDMGLSMVYRQLTSTNPASGKMVPIRPVEVLSTCPFDPLPSLTIPYLTKKLRVTWFRPLVSQVLAQWVLEIAPQDRNQQVPHVQPFLHIYIYIDNYIRVYISF